MKRVRSIQEALLEHMKWDDRVGRFESYMFVGKEPGRKEALDAIAKELGERRTIVRFDAKTEPDDYLQVLLAIALGIKDSDSTWSVFREKAEGNIVLAIDNVDYLGRNIQHYLRGALIDERPVRIIGTAEKNETDGNHKVLAGALMPCFLDPVDNYVGLLKEVRYERGSRISSDRKLRELSLWEVFIKRKNKYFMEDPEEALNRAIEENGLPFGANAYHRTFSEGCGPDTRVSNVYFLFDSKVSA